MEKLIDLHIHTNMSDGVLSPKEVIDEAEKNGVQVIAIADHDTVDAYSDELFLYAESKNIKLIKAVEISTKTKKNGIHVLGYNLDLKNEELRNKLSELRNARHDYLKNVSLKLQELGFVLNFDELDKIEAVTKAHIALDVVKNKKNHSILLKEFGHIPDKGEFIESIMNEGCKAYVKKASISPKEAADLIRKANGKVVLAHPVAYTYEDNMSEEEIYSLVKDMCADGIEANYIYIDKNHNKINDIKKWKEFAKKNNLLSTIGSDFHNDDGLHPLIGLKGENIFLNEDDANTILNFILS